jgi:hypothetical protein
MPGRGSRASLTPIAESGGTCNGSIALFPAEQTALVMGEFVHVDRKYLSGVPISCCSHEMPHHIHGGAIRLRSRIEAF